MAKPNFAKDQIQSLGDVRAMVWRVIEDYPGFEVSECGDVRRVSTGARLRGFIDADGYVRYSLTDQGGTKKARPAHQLVALAFLGPKPSPKHEVAHNNGSRLNCHYSNLRWALPVENHADRFVHRTASVGARNGRAKITESDVHAIRRDYRLIKQPGSGRRVEELERRYGLHRATIIDIARGRSWSHIPLPWDWSLSLPETVERLERAAAMEDAA